MLLEEVFAGVDPISVGEIQRIVKHLKNRGIGVLITDHNVRETLGICDRAYILNEGSVLAQGAPDALLANPDVRRVYLGGNLPSLRAGPHHPDRRPCRRLRTSDETTPPDIAGTATGHDAAAASGHPLAADVDRGAGGGNHPGRGIQSPARLGRRCARRWGRWPAGRGRARQPGRIPPRRGRRVRRRRLGTGRRTMGHLGRRLLR